MIAGGALAAVGVAGFMMSGSAEAAEPEQGPDPEPDITPSEPSAPAPTVTRPQVETAAPSEPPKPPTPSATAQPTAAKVKSEPTLQPQATPVLDETERADAGRYTNKLTNYVKGSIKTVERTRSLWERLFGRSEESDQGRSEESGQASGAEGSEGEMGGGSNNLPSSGSYDIKLARLLADYEGLRTSAYKDSVGIPTIGIGATYYPPGFRLQGRVQMGQTITREEAEYIKAEHVKEHRARLLREITSSEYSALPDGVKAALESKVFNYGSLGGPLAQLTKNAIRTRDYTMVSNYFRTTLAPHNRGINAWRRNDEAQIIQTGRSSRVRGLSFGTTPSPPSGEAAPGGADRAREASGRGAASSSGGGGPTPGREVVNTDNIREAIRGKSIWNYARKKDSGVDWTGLKPGMKDRFMAMAIDYHQQTGNKVQINSANRTYAKQAELYRRYGPRRAAPPGRSKHESGVAIDIQSTDAQRMIQLGLFEKYGFYRPYLPSETWHVEPTEASRVRGQADNPYEPGEPIAQTNRGGTPVIQTDTGATRPVSNERSQLGERAAGIAIQTRQAGQSSPTTIVPVPVGSGGTPQNPASYLTGTKAPPRGSSRNSAMDYKVYFNAA